MALPEALKQEIDRIVSSILSGIKNAPPLIKYPAIVVVAVIVLIAFRLGLAGESVQGLTQRILPWDIPFIDEPKVQTTLAFQVTRTVDGAERAVLVGEICQSGELLTIRTTPSQKTWLVLFGMDSKSGAYSISDKAYQAHLYEGAKPISFSVKLDKNVGIEAFIALTSTNPFQLTEDLLRIAHKELYAEGSKGIIPDHFAFKFGDKIDSWPFYCQHTD